MIKIWLEPAVTVLAMTSVVEPSHEAFKTWRTNDSGFNAALDIVPEIGGRVCYMSFGKGRPTNAEYIENIIRQGHESVLEHGTVTFGIQGISRTCSHEFVRHRHLSFSQLSQRYVSGEDMEFVLPIGWDAADARYADFRGDCANWRKHYADVIRIAESQGRDGKAARQVARAVLPGCTETKLVVTGNLRAWRHFVKLRGSTAADPEIRRLACAILQQLKYVSPHVFADLEVKDGEVKTVGTA